MRRMVPSKGGLGKRRAKEPTETDTPPDISAHHTQLLKGVLDMCLLAVIDEEPSYGYEMVRKLAERHLKLTSEGSIYPLLSRLKRSGLIDSYLVDSHVGPARKYYRSTPLGKTTLARWTADWTTFKAGVDDVLAGNTD